MVLLIFFAVSVCFCLFSWRPESVGALILRHIRVPPLLYLCVSSSDHGLMRPFLTTANRARLPPRTVRANSDLPTLRKHKASFMSLFTYLSVYHIKG